jgi:predicted permease
LTPVALTAVGLQVKVSPDAFKSNFLWFGLGYKLVFIPLVILILFKYIFNLKGLILQVSVIEAAMAPMITGSIIAITHDLEPKLASLLVGVGIPLSFLTIAIWYFILG